jgi:hypothetical protein
MDNGARIRAPGVRGNSFFTVLRANSNGFFYRQ